MDSANEWRVVVTKIYDILDFTRTLQASDDTVPVCLIDEAALMSLPGFVQENIGRAAAGSSSSSSSSGNRLNGGSSSNGGLAGSFVDFVGVVAEI